MFWRARIGVRASGRGSIYVSLNMTLAPRLEPRIEMRTLEPGTIRFEAPVDHCLSIHAGPDARISCRREAGQALATRGQLNLVPIGGYDECQQEDLSSAIELHLPSSLVRLAALEMGLNPDRASLLPRFCFRDPQLEHIAWALAAERSAGEESSRLYRESLGVALAVRLMSAYGTPGSIVRDAGLSPKQLARVQEWIESHLAREVSLHHLARIAGLSVSHFCVLFKRSMHVSVHEYVIRRRVERARTLLLSTELPGSEVALEAGFSHQSHMARCMRRVLGMAPSEIRR